MIKTITIFLNIIFMSFQKSQLTDGC